MKRKDLNLKQLIAFEAMHELQDAMKEYFELDEDMNPTSMTLYGLSTHKDSRTRIAERIRFYLQILDNPMGQEEYKTMCSNLLAGNIKESILEYYPEIDAEIFMGRDDGNRRMIDYYFDMINLALDQNNQKIMKIVELTKLASELYDKEEKS